MPTWRTSARNQFRTPSGVPGDPADGPGGMAALSDDVDAFLGVGGAEYCATAAARDAIPSSRRFTGKRAYNAADDTEYRWNGSAWKGWNGPWTDYTATLTGVTLGTGSVVASRYRYVGGLCATYHYVQLGTGGTISSTVDFTLPVQPFDVNQIHSQGSASSSTAAYVITPGFAGSTGSFTLRARAHTVSGSYITTSSLGTGIPFTWAAGNTLVLDALYRTV